MKPKIDPDKYKKEKVVYHIDDKKIAKVDAKGKLTGIATGKTKLTISAGGYDKTVTVSVKPLKIAGLKNIKIVEGHSKKISCRFTPAGYIHGKVTYKSSNSKIASVTRSGSIIGKKPGTARVTITAGNCKKRIKVKVEKYVVKQVEQAPSYTPSSEPSYKPSYDYNSSGSGSGSGGGRAVDRGSDEGTDAGTLD